MRVLGHQCIVSYMTKSPWTNLGTSYLWYTRKTTSWTFGLFVQCSSKMIYHFRSTQKPIMVKGKHHENSSKCTWHPPRYSSEFYQWMLSWKFYLVIFVSRGFNYRDIAYFNIAAIAFRGEQNNITTLIARNNFQFKSPKGNLGVVA